MLKITSVEDLKKYLEVRREMAHKQINSAICSMGGGERLGSYSQGMVYAFDEAIKAVEALLTHEHEEEC